MGCLHIRPSIIDGKVSRQSEQELLWGEQDTLLARLLHFQLVICKHGYTYR